jgi:hypothetical protein
MNIGLPPNMVAGVKDSIQALKSKPVILDVNKSWGIVDKQEIDNLEVQAALDFLHFAQLLCRVKL